MDFEITDMSWPNGWLFSLSEEECNPVVIFPPGFAIITSERSAGLPVRRNRYEGELEFYLGGRHDILHEEESGTAGAVRERILEWMR